MVWTSSAYDSFIIRPSSVTLTLDLIEQKFRMTLLHIKENNWAKLIWNPCKNLEVVAGTSTDYGICIIWTVLHVSMTFNLP